MLKFDHMGFSLGKWTSEIIYYIVSEVHFPSKDPKYVLKRNFSILVKKFNFIDQVYN